MTEEINIKLYGTFIENFPGYVSIRDKDLRLVYINHFFKSWVSEFTDIDIIGLTNKQVAELVPDHFAKLLCSCHDFEMDYCQDRSINNKVLEYIDPDKKETHYIDVLKFNGIDEEEDYTFTLGKDITHIYKEITYHKNQSHTDPLTAVGNRKLLDETSFENNDLFIYADLDNFKIVNDIYGHAVGDKILINFSKMLTDMFRANDRIIRMGGDEFLIVVKPNVGESEVNATARINALRNMFKQAFSDYPQLGISLGYSKFNIDVDDTLKIIDARMYEDKKTKYQRLTLA